jgi:hypothetical protein
MSQQLVVRQSVHETWSPAEESVSLSGVREVVLRTRATISAIQDIRSAMALVRRASAAGKMAHEALKLCQLAEREQFDLKQEAAETHLRTQRRAGELPMDLAKHPGGRPTTASSKEVVEEKPPTLRQLGINVHESHRWQRIAQIPHERFEDFVVTSRAERRELTAAAVMAYGKRLVRDTADDTMEEWLSSNASVCALYNRIRPQVAELIWIDPQELAAGMTAAERHATLSELNRWLLWIHECGRALDCVR